MAGGEGRKAREFKETTKAEAEDILNAAGTDASSWGEDLIAEMESVGDPVLDALAGAQIDGYGFEISAGGGVSGVVSVDFVPRGLCVLNITNSTEAGEVPGPHYYVFSEFSFGSGIGIEASSGVDAVGFIAHYFGENYSFTGDRKITAESFAGGAVSVNVEGGVSAGEGVDASFSLLASQDQGIFGLTNLATGDYRPGWQGIAGGVGISSGAGASVSVNMAMARTGPLDEALGFIFGRPDVEKAMKESDHLEWQRPEEPTEHPELDWARGLFGTNIYEEVAQ